MKSFQKIIIASLVLLLTSGCAKERLYNQKKFLLGTMVEVISPYPEAAQIVFGEIDRLEKVFSMFLEDSALSHLNKTGFLNDNYEIAFLIEKAKIFSELTQGEYDITIGPLTKIWKKAISENKLPDENQINEAMKLIGFKKVYIDKKNAGIKFREKDMQIDLGSIAKGYAVDAAIKELKRKGIDSALVNAGGNIYCLGTKFGKPWKLGLQHPRKKDKLFKTLELQDTAIATSGDYQQYMEIGSKRYSHIISPKTGYPVENDVASVTVIAKDATTADVISTCVFLLGKEKGLKVFQNYPGVKDIIVITKSDARNN